MTTSCCLCAVDPGWALGQRPEKEEAGCVSLPLLPPLSSLPPLPPLSSLPPLLPLPPLSSLPPLPPLSDLGDLCVMMLN